MIHALILLTALLSPQGGQKIYYFDGSTLSSLRTIQLPNVGTADIRLFVSSSVELSGAALDSSEVEMCIPTLSEREALHLSRLDTSGKGKWYKLSSRMKLHVGVSKHVLALTDSGGRKFKHAFSIAVEGTMKLKKPLENK